MRGTNQTEYRKRTSGLSLTMLTFTASILITSVHCRARTGRSSSIFSGCQEIQVPMCKGLVSYNITKLPNKFGHRTQADVYWALQPWWPFMDAGCSDNLRTYLCGLYLPRCNGDDVEPEYPCMETCKKAKVRCKKQMRKQKVRWSKEFKCRKLLPKASKNCIKPVRERKKDQYHHYTLCQSNKLSLCKGIPFPQGSLPNMFLQGDVDVIDKEMQQFQQLLNSGCSKKLRLFLCGVYMPFCVPGAYTERHEIRDGAEHAVIEAYPDVPIVVPCRELCQEVKDECSGEYEQRTHGLPWPGKFHCHRYPSYADRYDLVTQDDLDESSNITDGPRSGGHVPCTMPPYNFDEN